MNPIKKDFNQYRLQYYNGQAYIECWQGSAHAGTIVFVKDDTPLPPNKVVNNSIVLYYSLRRFNDVITILRYEKPLYLWLNPDNLLGCVSTTMEPIGEQEKASS